MAGRRIGANYRGRVLPTIPERFSHLVDATTELAERFARAEHALYLVGGSVRDAILADPAVADSRPEGGSGPIGKTGSPPRPPLLKGGKAWPISSPPL